MLIDSHCHLDCIDLSEFDNNFDNLIKHTHKQNVEHMLCVSINLKKYPDMLEKVRGYPNISVSAGMHPMADESGHYSGTNVDLMIELADAREAQRSYEANLKMFEQTRKMSSGLMDLLRR